MIENKEDIYVLLGKAQSKMTNPPLAGENPHFKSKYATLKDVLGIVRPALNGVGLFLTQPLEALEDGTQRVSTIVYKDSDTNVCLGSYKIVAGTPQFVGSATTYAKRYMLQSAFGLVGEEDDDGCNASLNIDSTKQPAKQAEPQQPPKLKPAKNPLLQDVEGWVTQYMTITGLSKSDVVSRMDENLEIKVRDIGDNYKAAKAAEDVINWMLTELQAEPIVQTEDIPF